LFTNRHAYVLSLLVVEAIRLGRNLSTKDRAFEMVSIFLREQARVVETGALTTGISL
jgi:hypothetical protein